MTAFAADVTPVRRGEIWWINLDPAQGSEIRKTRPAIVVTANAFNRARRKVVVVSLSTATTPAHHCLYPFRRAKFGCGLRSGACGRQAAPDEERRTAFGGGFAFRRGQPASSPGTVKADRTNRPISGLTPLPVHRSWPTDHRRICGIRPTGLRDNCGCGR